MEIIACLGSSLIVVTGPCAVLPVKPKTAVQTPLPISLSLSLLAILLPDLAPADLFFNPISEIQSEKSSSLTTGEIEQNIQ